MRLPLINLDKVVFPLPLYPRILIISPWRTRLWNRQARFLLYIRIPAVLLLVVGIMRGRYDVGTFIMLFGLVKSCGEQMNSLAYNIVQISFAASRPVSSPLK